MGVFGGFGRQEPEANGRVSPGMYGEIGSRVSFDRRVGRMSIRATLSTALLTTVAAVVGCQGSGGGEYGDLDVQTFELQYIEPAAASRIIEPYVFSDRGGYVSIEQEVGLITVRETPEMLSRIEEVLKRYDQPEPSVRLHFRIIEANGAGGADPALAEIEEALPRDVFKFKNYRQVAEAVMTGIEWSEISQQAYGDGKPYQLEGRIGEVRAAGDSGTVQLEIGLITQRGRAFQTAVNARLGQLLVLGSAQPYPGGGAVILAVRAELEQP